MSVRTIKLLGDDVLRAECEPVETVDDEIRRLADDLQETMYEADGIGLAAPQVGVELRMFAYDVRDPEAPAGVIIDPEIVEQSDETEKEPEGCLSIPGIREVVERPARVVMEGLDPDGREVRLEADGLLARCLQHEYDHLDGVLFLDRISAFKRKMALDKWSKMSEEERRSAAAAL